MILKEQLLKNRNRILWRGSIHKNWDSTKTVFGCPYVTTKVVYALNFSKDFDEPIVDHAKYLTQFVIKKPLNLFNARSKKDIQKLEAYFRTHDMLSWLGTLPLLADNDWLDVFDLVEREYLIDILKELNYDGFVNIEGNSGKILRNAFYTLDVVAKNDLYGFDGIGIFDLNNLREVKVLQGWDEIKKESEVQYEINSVKDIAIKLLFGNWDKYENNEKLFIQDALLHNEIRNFLSEDDLHEMFSKFDYESFNNTLDKKKKFLKENHRPLHSLNYFKVFKESTK